MPTRIDLNADLGEGFGPWRAGDDEALLDVVTSANVACGFHAGDPRTMLETCRRAVAHGVAVGAHPGHRDLVGFGRRAICVDADDVHAETLHQVGALAAAAAAAGTRVAHVKPHGALYHQLAADDERAAAFLAAVRAALGRATVFGPDGSALARAAAAAGLPFAAEAFCDRAYAPDGSLVPRGWPGAMLHDAEAVAERAVRLAREGRVEATDGTDVRVAAATLCVHGDTPGAVRLAHAVRDALRAAGVELAAPTPTP